MTDLNNGHIVLENKKHEILDEDIAEPSEKVVLSAKVPKFVSTYVRDLVSHGEYRTINEFVEQAIIEKILKNKEKGGFTHD